MGIYWHCWLDMGRDNNITMHASHACLSSSFADIAIALRLDRFGGGDGDY